jgi:hypothetical protein
MESSESGISADAIFISFDLSTSSTKIDGGADGETFKGAPSDVQRGAQLVKCVDRSGD